MPTSENEKMQHLWKLITDFSKALNNSINGTYEKSKSISDTKVPAGSKIRLIFEDIFSDINNRKATGDYTD